MNKDEYRHKQNPPQQPTQQQNMPQAQPGGTGLTEWSERVSRRIETAPSPPLLIVLTPYDSRNVADCTPCYTFHLP